MYIYDISSLRVNDLTLILLTWRKWRAPNNASKQQMGFNSAFKGLIGISSYGKNTWDVHTLYRNTESLIYENDQQDATM